MKKYMKFAAASLILSLSLLLSAGCCLSGTRKEEPVSDTGFYFDTVVKITLYGVKDDSLIRECFSRMAEYESMLSRTREGSDVWNINHSQGLPTKVSADTAALIKTALYYAEISDGAFDITIAPVTDLWSFEGEGEHDLTDPEKIKEALTHVDYHQIELDGSIVTLKDAKAAIDLGGIAKGYIADRLKEFLVSQGITSGIIDLGGNLLTIGEKPDGTPWKLGVRKPFAQTASELAATVTANGLSLVTSGTYERYFEKDGTLYHHILDKNTGYPAKTGLSSVSILCGSSVDGDALSTACFLLGPDRGMVLIESLENTEALFITGDGNLRRSSGFPYE